MRIFFGLQDLLIVTEIPPAPLSVTLSIWGFRERHIKEFCYFSLVGDAISQFILVLSLLIKWFFYMFLSKSQSLKHDVKQICWSPLKSLSYASIQYSSSIFPWIFLWVKLFYDSFMLLCCSLQWIQFSLSEHEINIQSPHLFI